MQGRAMPNHPAAMQLYARAHPAAEQVDGNGVHAKSMVEFM